MTPQETSLLSCSASVRSKTPGWTGRYKAQSWGRENINLSNLLSSTPGAHSYSVTVSQCHTVTLSKLQCQIITVTLFHFSVSVSQNHSVTLLKCHTVTL